MSIAPNDLNGGGPIVGELRFPTVAIFCRFNWRQVGPVVDKDTARLIDMIGACTGIRMLATDWRTIDLDRAIDVIEPESGARRRLPLGHLDLIHVYSIGRLARGDTSLRAKWKKLLEKLAIVDACGVRCINSTRAIRAGMSKGYLLELAARGVPIVPTKRVPATVTLERLKQECGTDFHVVKPENGECGKWVLPLARITERDLKIYARETDHLLLQPFMGEALAGEKSLIFFGEKFSHGVRKIPAFRDFRANGPHVGAEVIPYCATAAELDLARSAAAAFAHRLETFRVDLVGEAGTLKIMELEVVDPGHYCAPTPAYARRLGQFYMECLPADSGIRATI